MDIEIVDKLEEKKLREPNGKTKRLFEKFMNSEAKICKLINLPKDKTLKQVYNNIYRRLYYYKYPINVKMRDGIIYLVRTDMS